MMNTNTKQTKHNKHEIERKFFDCYNVAAKTFIIKIIIIIVIKGVCVFIKWVFVGVYFVYTFCQLHVYMMNIVACKPFYDWILF